jgi:hypothetical protein
MYHICFRIPEYKKVPSPLPLSFDRVNERRPPASDARVLNLPIELLGVILAHVPAESLASLA